jgi:hypothetical protein
MDLVADFHHLGFVGADGFQGGRGQGSVHGVMACAAVAGGTQFTPAACASAGTFAAGA